MDEIKKQAAAIILVPLIDYQELLEEHEGLEGTAHVQETTTVTVRVSPLAAEVLLRCGIGASAPWVVLHKSKDEGEFWYNVSGQPQEPYGNASYTVHWDEVVEAKMTDIVDEGKELAVTVTVETRASYEGTLGE